MVGGWHPGSVGGVLIWRLTLFERSGGGIFPISPVLRKLWIGNLSMVSGGMRPGGMRTFCDEGQGGGVGSQRCKSQCLYKALA